MTDCTRFEASIVDFLDASLASEEQRSLAAHVAGCARCGATLRAYRRIETSYRELPELEPRPELAAHILAAAKNELRPARPWRRRVLLVAAGLALVFGPPLYRRLRDDKPAPTKLDAVTELLRSADALRDVGHRAEARVTYEQALAQAPADLRAEIVHRLAELALESGDYARALPLLEEVCEVHRDYSGRESALLERARALVELGRIREARQAYARIPREFPAAATEVERRLQSLPDEELNLRLQALGYGGNDER